jgi:hypothetical protein
MHLPPGGGHLFATGSVSLDTGVLGVGVDLGDEDIDFPVTYRCAFVFSIVLH